jgi:hypothetical protein
MGNSVIKCSQIEIAHPSQACFVMFTDAPLKGRIGNLPAPEEEDAVRLLEDVAEDNLKLK